MALDDSILADAQINTDAQKGSDHQDSVVDDGNGNGNGNGGDSLLADEVEPQGDTVVDGADDGGTNGDDPTDKDPNKDKEVGAPEEYEEFGVEDGFEFDKDRLDSFKDWAKGKDLNQESAQEALDMATGIVKDVRKADAEALGNMRKDFREQVKSDELIGGAEYKKNLAVGRKAVDAFGDDELKGMLYKSWLGDHPAVNRFLFKVGKAVSEDSMIDGSPGRKGGDTASIMYPNSGMK